MTNDTSDLTRHAWRRTIASLLIFAAFLFVPAGTLRFWQGWFYALIFAGASAIIGIYFRRHDPALLARRMRAGPAAEQEPAQKTIISAIIISFLLLVALPGFDHRWHWSAVPTWLVLVADAGVAASFVIFFVVMKQNSYAASTIQVEADQPVVSTGLYGIVRHPMYAGALLLMLCTPLALGSYWGLLVFIATIPILAWRLLDEESFLRRNLPGYADYCIRVRWRLIPGIW